MPLHHRGGRRTLPCIVLGLAFGVLTTACGGSGADAEDVGTEQSTPSDPDPENAPGNDAADGSRESPGDHSEAGPGPVQPPPPGSEGEKGSDREAEPEYTQDPAPEPEITPVGSLAAEAAWLLTDQRLLRLGGGGTSALDPGPLAQHPGGSHGAVSIPRNRLYLLRGATLHAHDLGADLTPAPTLSRPVPGRGPVSALAVGTMRLAAARGRHLYLLDHELNPVAERDAGAEVIDIALAAGDAWVLLSDRVLRYSADGEPRGGFDLEVADAPRRLAAREGQIWVATANGVAVHAANGAREARFDVDEPLAIELLDDGSAWLVGTGELLRVNDRGDVLSSALPAAQGFVASIVAASANPADGSLLLMAGSRLLRAGSEGLLRLVAESGGVKAGEVRNLLRYDDVHPPRIEFMEPDGHAAGNEARPGVVLQAQDIGLGIDWSTLVFRIDGADATPTCDPPTVRAAAGPETFTCFPGPLAEGRYELDASVRDRAGHEGRAATATLDVDTTAPTISLDSPADGVYLSASSVRIAGRLSESATLTVDGRQVGLDVEHRFSTDVALASDGAYAIELVAKDSAGNTTARTLTIYRDTMPPPAPDPDLLALDGSQGADGGTMRVSGDAGAVEPGATVRVENTRTGARVLVLAGGDGTFAATVNGLPGDTYTITVLDRAENASEPVTVVGGSLNATPIEPAVNNSIERLESFLYQGEDPVQKGVAPGTIEPRRLAVVRGLVTDREGEPLAGVRVSVRNRPEFGYTATRPNGEYDLAVNGGGLLTLDFETEGRLPAQRQVRTPWQDYVFADDVALIELDQQATVIALGDDGAGVQVARGSVEEDADGPRQATMLFPPGVRASVRDVDGNDIQLTEMTVRATEYTVGPNGPTAMPGELPPASGYTYAVELSVDEAIAAGADTVRFSESVPLYVENFLGMPVGGLVPAGFYDRERAAWIPSDNGLVIEILAIEGGRAVIDMSGDGPATADDLAVLGIDAAELRQLADLYEAGDTLWRTPLDHFSPWDLNWPYGWPDDAREPLGPEDRDGVPLEDKDKNEECGCIIHPEDRSLAEEIPVPGTPFRLRYDTRRQPGYSKNRLEIPLTRGVVPESLERIDVTIYIAGLRVQESFDPETDQTWVFEWDGKDARGRTRTDPRHRGRGPRLSDALQRAVRRRQHLPAPHLRPTPVRRRRLRPPPLRLRHHRLRPSMEGMGQPTRALAHHGVRGARWVDAGCASCACPALGRLGAVREGKWRVPGVFETGCRNRDAGRCGRRPPSSPPIHIRKCVWPGYCGRR